MNKVQKKPNLPKAVTARKRPVEVRSYFKKGKRISGYNRRKAGDATLDKKSGG